MREQDVKHDRGTRWWLMPALGFGALGWIAIFYFAAPALASAFDTRPEACAAYRGAEVAACISELR